MNLINQNISLHSVSSTLKGRRSALSMLVVFVLLGLFAPVQKVEAQQDFINGFYMYNPLAFNPAITGVNDQIVISAISRDQWTDVTGAPTTQYVDFHMPVVSFFDRYDRVGSISYPTGLSTGLSIVNDKIGATNYVRASVPLSARVRLTKSGIRMSLGLRFDGAQFSSNYLDLRAKDEGDPNIVYTGPKTYFDMSAGIYVYHTNWYVGASMTNIRGFDITADYGYEFVPHFFATVGVAIPVSSDLVLRMTSLATIVEDVPFSMTVTPSVIIMNNIETGLSYRYHDMVGAFFSFKPTTNLRIGYWYEYAIGKKQNEVGATHEIVLQYTIDRFKKQIVSPRYFW